MKSNKFAHETSLPPRWARGVGVGLLGGALIGCLGEPVKPAAAQAPEPPARPAWQQTFEPMPEQVEVTQDAAQPTVVAPVEPKAPQTPKVVLAVAHTEGDVDHGEQAKKQLDAGDLREAVVSMRKHLHTTEPTADLMLVLGRTARQVDQLELAEAALEAGIALDHRRGDLAVELARVHMDGRSPEKAESAARRALRVSNDNADAWNQLGRAAMARSEWQLAELAFERAVDLDPIDGMFHNNLGLLLVYMKRGPDAVEVLERAVDLLADSAPHYVFNNLGLAHELSGQNEEAREAFEEALLLNPFYTRARVNLNRVTERIARIEDGKSFETAQGAKAQPEEKDKPDA